MQKIDWLRFEQRLRGVLQQVNEAEPRAREAMLVWAITYIDEILASETRRGGELERASLLEANAYEIVQAEAWEEIE